MEEILNIQLFSLGSRAITLMELLATLLSLGLVIYLYRLGVRYFAPKLQQNIQVSDKNRSKIWRVLRWLFLFLTLIVIISTLKLDYSFNLNENYQLGLLTVLKALFFWQLAQLLDWAINNLFIDYFYPKNTPDYLNKPQVSSKARKTVQYVFYLIVIIYIIRNFGLDIQFHEMTLSNKEGAEPIRFMLSNFFEAGLVILVAQLIIWALIHLVLLKVYEKRQIDVGSQFAINQLIKYLIYIFAIISALSVIGISMTLLLGGAAALLVGIGLGLQQTFNDFISGIVLLFERTVSVGDILEFDGTVGEVQKIGLRSSILHTRQNVSMVVPNHLLVNEKVINWTHFDNNIRFDIDVGVAYGSDTALVKSLLVKAVENIPQVLDKPKPFVRFNSFGNSSLDFTLYFFSKEYMLIEDVRSEVRLEVDRLFRENNVSIPFPQREVRILNKD